MKLVSIKCPECSANLNVEEGRKQCYCSYCGAEIMLENENEQIYRRIDDAKVKEAEVKEKVRLKELELEEYRMKSEEVQKKKRTKIAVCLLVVGAICCVLGFLLAKLSGDSDSGFYMLSMVGLFFILGSAYVGLLSGDNNKKDNENDK